jgi:hypothetical protein
MPLLHWSHFRNRIGDRSGARGARSAAAALGADWLGFGGLVGTALDSDDGKDDDDRRVDFFSNRFPGARSAPDPGKLHDRSHLVFPCPSGPDRPSDVFVG